MLDSLQQPGLFDVLTLSRVETKLDLPRAEVSISDGIRSFCGLKYSLGPVTGWLHAKEMFEGKNSNCMSTLISFEAWVDPRTVRVVYDNGLPGRDRISWGFGPAEITSRQGRHYNTRYASFTLVNPDDYDWVEPICRANQEKYHPWIGAPKTEVERWERAWSKHLK